MPAAKIQPVEQSQPNEYFELQIITDDAPIFLAQKYNATHRHRISKHEGIVLSLKKKAQKDRLGLKRSLTTIRMVMETA